MHRNSAILSQLVAPHWNHENAMQADKLMHLIYTSAATPEFQLSDLKTILQGAHSKNAQRAVTGMDLTRSRGHIWTLGFRPLFFRALC